VDIAQPDVARSGRITECLRIGSLRAADKGCDSHLERRCSAHRQRSRGRGVGQWDGGRVDHWMPVHGRCCWSRPTFETAAPLTSRPGLGVVVDPVMLARAPAGFGPSPGNYADLVFDPEATRRSPTAARATPTAAPTRRQMSSNHGALIGWTWDHGRAGDRVDLDGASRRASSEYPCRRPAQAGPEQDPEAWWTQARRSSPPWRPN
jgi:hypothetical protein